MKQREGERRRRREREKEERERGYVCERLCLFERERETYINRFVYVCVCECDIFFLSFHFAELIVLHLFPLFYLPFKSMTVERRKS